ncbi:MAG: hypothetical protein HY543_06220 [Deltaproteobacteria bacterium]|nr:hypothetical protein [Deltaproteobacteria bacterium]
MPTDTKKVKVHQVGISLAGVPQTKETAELFRIAGHYMKPWREAVKDVAEELCESPRNPTTTILSEDEVRQEFHLQMEGSVHQTCKAERSAYYGIAPWDDEKELPEWQKPQEEAIREATKEFVQCESKVVFGKSEELAPGLPPSTYVSNFKKKWAAVEAMNVRRFMENAASLIEKLTGKRPSMESEGDCFYYQEPQEHVIYD